MQTVNNYDHYRIFYHVANECSMGRAAQLLGMVPSSITKNIQTLENELDCKLFVRSVHGVELTKEGKILFERVKPAFKLIQTAEQEIASLLSLESGTLNIGLVSDIIPNAITSDWLVEFQELYPKVNVNMANLSKEAVVSALNTGDIDLVLCGRPVKGEADDHYFDGVNLEELMLIRDIAVVGGKFIHLADKPITIEELKDIPLIFASERYSRAYREYENTFIKHGMEFAPSIKTCVVGMQVNAVRHGLGYTFIPSISIKKPIRAGEVKILKISNIEPYKQLFCVATSREFPLSRAAKAFISILKNNPIDGTDDLISMF